MIQVLSSSQMNRETYRCVKFKYGAFEAFHLKPRKHSQWANSIGSIDEIG
ncbi:hypothetical protein ALP8811_02156 [Aliiroseovarius pelagivivens]|uniref:Uncharacterized protein n=1 Tax=Aliiroseovarius pelagivivens TaxID=1639690 RepID=A0A2R8AM60_9RHOB|nr:hypothetical protein ALP8811_02156 [Aliiroseovarius pelagivivens]